MLDQTDRDAIARVNDFWRSAGAEAWFRKDAAFDDDFREKFEELHYQAARRECDQWNTSAEGALALMILLDQFPRNCFRGTAHMFATDPLARMYATQAIERGFDRGVPEDLRSFIYIPFEHSEDIADQRRSVDLFAPLGGEVLKYAVIHLEIIERFGRFPHRNKALGRQTTAEEKAFLDEGGFSG